MWRKKNSPGGSREASVHLCICVHLLCCLADNTVISDHILQQKHPGHTVLLFQKIIFGRKLPFELNMQHGVKTEGHKMRLSRSCGAYVAWRIVTYGRQVIQQTAVKIYFDSIWSTIMYSAKCGLISEEKEKYLTLDFTSILLFYITAQKVKVILWIAECPQCQQYLKARGT